MYIRTHICISNIQAEYTRIQHVNAINILAYIYRERERDTNITVCVDTVDRATIKGIVHDENRNHNPWTTAYNRVGRWKSEILRTWMELYMLRLECRRIPCSPRILPNFASRHGRFLTALGSFSTSMMGKRWTMNDYDRCLVVFFSNGIVTVMIKTTSIAPSPIDRSRC